MKQLFKEITEWQHKVFTKANTQSKLAHLQQEVIELVKEPYSDEEYADCFLLLIGAWESRGKNYEELLQCIRQKFEVNKKRNWGEPDSEGVVNHIK